MEKNDRSKITPMKKSLCALAVLALGTSGALAQQAGDWVVGAGWLHFAPQDSSKPLTFTSPIQAEVPGSGAGVDNSNALGLNAVYFVDSRWVVEGVLGVPPKFKLQGEGSLARVGQLGEAKQWSPTILGKYYFGNGNDAFRPFLGLGATYVWYSDVNLSANLQNSIGAQLRRPDGLIEYQVYGEGYPVLLYAPGGLKSRMAMWHSPADGPGRPAK